MKFNEKLKRPAHDHNLSAREVAERAGVKSHSTVNRWIKGEILPRLPDLEKLANLFGVPVAYLTDDRADSPRTEAEAQFSEGERRLIEIGRRIGAEQAARVLDLVVEIGPVDDVVTFMSFAKWAGLRVAMERLLDNPHGGQEGPGAGHDVAFRAEGDKGGQPHHKGPGPLPRPGGK